MQIRQNHVVFMLRIWRAAINNLDMKFGVLGHNEMNVQERAGITGIQTRKILHWRFRPLLLKTRDNAVTA